MVIFPETEEQTRSLGQHGFEGWEYYCTDRARHPRSGKSFTWNSIDRIVALDAFRPLLMIVGTEAVTRYVPTEAIANAQQPKELYWIDGASHVDLYDKDEYVTPAVDKMVEFFRAVS